MTLYPLRHQHIQMDQTKPKLQMIFLQFHTPRSTDHPLRKQLNFLRKPQCALILQGKLIWFFVSDFFKFICVDSFIYFFLSCCSLKNLLKTKANAFLSNDYYESDIAWMELVSIIILFSPFLFSFPYDNAPLILILLLRGKLCWLLLCLLSFITAIMVGIAKV